MTPPHLVIGAGPAGLTAARELARRGRSVTVLEADETYVGGLSRTHTYHGNRFDLGGHRFYTKNAEIERLWHELLPDDLLTVPRLSRIRYRGRLFPYPIELGPTLRGLGMRQAVAVSASWLRAAARPRHPESSFEDWIVNRFGRHLYEAFFRTYTEKVWGVPCTEISKDWAAQRIRGLTFAGAVRNMVGQRTSPTTVKTLITSFSYPRLGPGQLWERVRDQVVAAGGDVLHGKRVVGIRRANGRAVEVVASDGTSFVADHVFVSMPLRDLAGAFQPSAPAAVERAGASLRFRDFLTVALVVAKPELFPDTWIYVHDAGVRVGRIQNYGNWSPSMVGQDGTTCLGLEYFCSRGDAIWEMDDKRLVELAARELEAVGLARAVDCVDGQVVRVPDAYPIYDPGYRENRQVVRAWLDEAVPNVHPMGRGGLHNYNSQDHAMVTALMAVGNALDGHRDDVWAVNTEEEYAEVAEVHRVGTGRLTPSFANGRHGPGQPLGRGEPEPHAVSEHATGMPV